MILRRKIITVFSIFISFLVVGFISWLLIMGKSYESTLRQVSIKFDALMGSSYDAPVRELSLKLEDLSKFQLESNSSVGDLKEKITLFEQEISLSATKLPAGKNGEIVRSYYGASLKYLESWKQVINAYVKQSVDKDATNVPGSCTAFDAISYAICTQNDKARELSALYSYGASLEKYKKSMENMKKEASKVISARDLANTIVSEDSIVVMGSFNKLIAK